MKQAAGFVDMLRSKFRTKFHLSTFKVVAIIIQWHNSPLPGQGRFTVRFLDHMEFFLGRVISSPQGGQAITLRKFVIIPDPPTRVLWQLG
jgi:hypothetical protein